MGQAQPILKARAFLGFSGLQTEAQSPQSPRFIDHNKPFGKKREKKLSGASTPLFVCGSLLVKMLLEVNKAYCY